MKKTLKLISIATVATFFTACVPVPQPHIGTSIGGAYGGGASSNEYGVPPSNYVSSIKSYFSTKLPRAKNAKYKFSQPKRAYKRKGFAYGGEIDWKGWLVETSIATRSRTGRLLTPKPYMVLFTGNQIVEDILGSSHKLLTKVDR